MANPAVVSVSRSVQGILCSAMHEAFDICRPILFSFFSNDDLHKYLKALENIEHRPYPAHSFKSCFLQCPNRPLTVQKGPLESLSLFYARMSDELHLHRFLTLLILLHGPGPGLWVLG